MLRLSKSRLVDLPVKLFAACEVNEGELRDEAGLLFKLLLHLDILLAVLASAEVRHHRLIKVIRRIIVPRVELNQEDGVTARACDILGRLVNLSAAQRLPQNRQAFFIRFKGQFLDVLDNNSWTVSVDIQLLDLRHLRLLCLWAHVGGEKVTVAE